MCLPVMYLEPLWLLHIYFTIQEGFLHIHLMHLPFHYCGKQKYSPNGGISHHGRKCLLIFNALLLRESSSQKYSLILFNIACHQLQVSSCRSILNLLLFSPLLWGPHPKHHSLLWTNIPPPWHPSIPSFLQPLHNLMVLHP
jgi:hypothetical protein